MKKFIVIGKEFGFDGPKLLEFVKEQRKLEQEREEEEERLRKEQEEKEKRLRKEQEEKEKRRGQRRKAQETRGRAKEARGRELLFLLLRFRRRRLEKEVDLMRQKEANKAANREHELELARLMAEGHVLAGLNNTKEDRAETPIVSYHRLYLQRFERFVVNAKWERTEWATKYSALLPGLALDVYSCLSESAATDHDQMKPALIERQDLIEEGYRRKFRASNLKTDESPDQFIALLSTYLVQWIELSNTAKMV